MDGGSAPRQRPLVFVEDLERPQLDADDLHHLERVLRLKPGQPVTVGDGRGRWREARFGPEPEPVGVVHVVAAPEPAITVAFVPVKGESPEWYAQKLTELGVDEIVPVVSDRSVVRWDERRATRQLERMTATARGACMQCRRVWLPRISPVVELGAFIDRSVSLGRPVALADPAGGVLGSHHTTLVIGPEGGFSDHELARAEQIVLPGHVLRAPTAAVVAAAMACGLRAGMLSFGSPD